MDGRVTSSLLRFFLDVPDPRAGNISHRFTDVVSIAVLATLCGAQGWTDVEFWAQNHIEWLATFLALRAAIPSHDTFSHVFAAIDPDAFERCFMTWTQSLVESSARRPASQQFVAIPQLDVAGKGKTTEVRYFICSYKKPDAKRVARAIRDHWGIENAQHHVLDVTMNEDACRIRVGDGAQNFARLRRVPLALIRSEHRPKSRRNAVMGGMPMVLIQPPGRRVKTVR